MITIDELSKRYDDLLAVDRLSLEIPKGQVMGLLGPNGAGKSTTLRILTGFLQPTGGTIYVDGHDVRNEAEQAKALIGYLPESSPLYTDMLVFDYLMYIAEVRGISGEARVKRIREMAELCGIGGVMHKNIAALSKGYRQRVGLALAMMSDPAILVLDEPTSGLDPNQIGEIRSIIREIGREKTVIFSTHILSEAEATCDRVVIINKGKIAADGSMGELLAGQGTSSLSLQIKGASEAEARSVLENIPGIGKSRFEERERLVNVHLESQEDLREPVYRAVRRQDWILMELHRESQSLESIFRQLTQGGEN